MKILNYSCCSRSDCSDLVNNFCWNCINFVFPNSLEMFLNMGILKQPLKQCDQTHGNPMGKSILELFNHEALNTRVLNFDLKVEVYFTWTQPRHSVFKRRLQQLKKMLWYNLKHQGTSWSNFIIFNSSKFRPWKNRETEIHCCVCEMDDITRNSKI